MRSGLSRVFPVIAALIIALVEFTSSAHAFIESIEVDPPTPTNNDALRITVRGSLGNSCQHVDSALVYGVGLDWVIFATDSSTQSSICEQVLQPYGYYFDLEPLGPGTHTITVQERLQTEDGLVTDDTTAFLTVTVDCAQVFTHDAGNLEMSISTLGMYGVDPTSASPSECGVGFVYDQETTQNLYEGAFLLATGPNRVSDNARNSVGVADDDFRMIPDGELSVLDDVIDGRRQEFTYSAFSDSAAENPIYVGVEQRTWADSDPAGDDYVILQYDIFNLSGSPINNAYAALFFDWDFPPGFGDSDDGDYSVRDEAGWMKHSGQNRYRALAVLTPPGATSYRYFQNDPEIYHYLDGADPQYDGFTGEEKWSAMTSGFGQVQPLESGDGSHLIATGPISLSADQDEFVRIAFAVIGATSETGLAAAATHARGKYQELFTVDYAAGDIETINAQSPHTVSVTYGGGSGTVTGSFYYRKGGRSNFTLMPMNDGGTGELTITIPAAQLGLQGIEYYMRVSQGSQDVRIPDGDGFYVFRTQMAGIPVVTTSAQEYQMIGFPFDPTPASVETIFNEVTDRSAKGWRFGRWNPASNQYFAYPDLTTVHSGHGYWLITSDDKTITASGLSAIPDEVFAQDRYAEISVEPGWNQIANPFAFAVTRSAIDFGSGVERLLYEYVANGSGSGYESATTLRPYIGYWVYNDGSRSHIRVPHSDASASLSAEKPAGTDGGWRLRFRVRSANREDVLNVVGVHPAAAVGYDELDFHEPPGFMEYVSMSFLQTRDSGDVHRLAGDFRPPNQSGYTFEVLIAGNTGEPVELSTEVESALPPGYRAVLVSQSAGAVFDLLDQPSVTLPVVASESGSFYRLLAGEEEDIAEGSASNNPLPQSYSLSQNYPNPFNAGTVISYFLPEATDVDIRVYDVLGRPITTLVRGEREAGHHQASWDGRDAQNRDVASGVYFYRLATPDFTATKKMILLR